MWNFNTWHQFPTLISVGFVKPWPSAHNLSHLKSTMSTSPYIYLFNKCFFPKDVQMTFRPSHSRSRRSFNSHSTWHNRHKAAGAVTYTCIAKDSFSFLRRGLRDSEDPIDFDNSTHHRRSTWKESLVWDFLPLNGWLTSHSPFADCSEWLINLNETVGHSESTLWAIASDST